MASLGDGRTRRLADLCRLFRSVKTRISSGNERPRGVRPGFTAVESSRRGPRHRVVGQLSPYSAGRAVGWQVVGRNGVERCEIGGWLLAVFASSRSRSATGTYRRPAFENGRVGSNINPLRVSAGRQDLHVARSLRDREWAWNNALWRPFPSPLNRHRGLPEDCESNAMETVGMRVSERLADTGPGGPPGPTRGSVSPRPGMGVEQRPVAAIPIALESASRLAGRLRIQRDGNRRIASLGETRRHGSRRAAGPTGHFREQEERLGQPRPSPEAWDVPPRIPSYAFTIRSRPSVTAAVALRVSTTSGACFTISA